VSDFANLEGLGCAEPSMDTRSSSTGCDCCATPSRLAYYRCRYPSDYALANRVVHPKNVIMREDLAVEPVDHWIASVFDPSRREQTIETLARQVTAEIRPAVPKQRTGGSLAAEFDKKIARYKQALVDEGASSAVVAAWIAEAKQQRDASLASRPAARRDDAVDAMTPEDIASLIEELGDIAAALEEATPEHKLDLYRSLRLRLTYVTETQTVHAAIDLGEHRWDLVRVREGRVEPQLHDHDGG
jgi:hypothetical protein